MPLSVSRAGLGVSESLVALLPNCRLRWLLSDGILPCSRLMSIVAETGLSVPNGEGRVEEEHVKMDGDISGDAYFSFFPVALVIVENVAFCI